MPSQNLISKTRHLQQFNPLQTLCEEFELFLWRILEKESENLDDEKVIDFILTYQERYIWSCCLTLIIEESIYALRWFSEQLINKYFGNKCFSERVTTIQDFLKFVKPYAIRNPVF